MAEISWEEIKAIAFENLQKRKCPQEYTDRFEFEIKEIEKQGAITYWTNLYTDGKNFTSNPNFLLFPWLLGMVQGDPIAARTMPMLNSVRASVVAEFNRKNGFIPSDLIKDPDQPDIDIDCLPEARDPIKDYATKRYGAHIKDGYGAVCSVGTWQTYKFRSGLIDVCAATGWLDKQEILVLTTNLPDDVDELKDGGKSNCKGRITDADTGEETECGNIHNSYECPKCGSSDTDGTTIGKLLREHKDLHEFAKRHPKIVTYAVNLVGRIRNMGMHAGALIIADRTLYGNIPMAKSSKKNYWISMWTEGRNTQLSKFGYIKWDILGLKTLKYIFECCKLIEANRGISFGKNMSGWDDIDPSQDRAGHFFDGAGEKCIININDPYALQLANDQKTDGVFQFDTDLAKSILANGVRNFEDLMLFNAMGHPGPMASIPEAVQNRDDSSGSWKKRLHPDVLPILESTYGVICFHEDTLISLADGRHLPIRDIESGMLVHAPNLATGVVDKKHVESCGPTLFGDGLKITLDNGYSIVITDNHKLCLWDDELKEAGKLKIGDLVAVPLKLLHDDICDEFVPRKIAAWLGYDRDVGYLLGQSVGDLAASGTGSSLCVGTEVDCDILASWIALHFHSTDGPKLLARKYFHCRCWYLQLSSIEKTPQETIQLPQFVDDCEWWESAYELASGVEIARSIGRSTWFVYDRLNKYNLVYRRKPKIRTTAWQDLLRSVGLKTNLWSKRIPEVIFQSDLETKCAYLAGMIDSDGTISVNKRGYDIVHYTSESPLLIQDLCHLLQLLGVAHTAYRNRVFIWDTGKLRSLVENFLLTKRFTGRSLTGMSVGWVPKTAVLQAIMGLSKREAERLGLVSRATLRYRCNRVKTKTAIKAGIDVGDFRYFQIIKIEPVSDQQFFNLSVEGNHTVVANGIASHQCYQEQLQAIWQKMAGFTAPEAQEARKAVAKKWAHKLKPIREKWLTGASRTMGLQEANEYWPKMETFGRYAFNRSHAVSYCLVAFKCLWLKAHFAPEWWAAVMSDCHPLKLVRYMGVARSENWEPTDITYCGSYKPEVRSRGVKFDTINIENLTTSFTVTGDVVNQGLIGIKGLGEAAAAIWTGQREFTSLDDLVDTVGRDKTIFERFIKLGSFKQFKGYENAKATWEYYKYKYCSGKDITKLRKEVKAKLLLADGWDEETINAERERQIKEYFEIYPNRRKVPAKFENWMPKPDDTPEKVMALFKEDFELKKVLEFEKAYLGYYLHSPLDLYDTVGNCTIEDAKVAFVKKGEARLEGVIIDFQVAESKKGNPYGRVILSDGIQNTLVLIFGKQLLMQDEKVLEPGTGVQMYVEYDEMRNTFSLMRGEVIIRLLARGWKERNTTAVTTAAR